jgi:hypothetical protein
MSNREHSSQESVPPLRPGKDNIRPILPSVAQPDDSQSQQSGAFLCKLLGLYMILLSLTMMIRKQATVDIVNSIMRNPPLLFVLGTLGMTAGLALVIAHNAWSGSASTVVVTLVGWAALIKGLVLMLTATQATSGAWLATVRYEEFFYFYMAIPLLLGSYLTYAGARSTAPKR